MSKRSLLGGTFVAAVIVAALWGIWVFESRAAARGVSPNDEFVFPLDNDTNASPDLVVMCPEDALEKPGEAFTKWLKLDGIPVKIPGGPMILARLNDVTLDESLRPIQRSAVEILKRYSPRRVVLVAHTYCIYYDTVAAWNDDLASSRKHEIEDMRAAINVLRGWFPNAEVSGYLAEKDPERGLVFRPLDKLKL